ncbi:MAG: hypothetical protein JWN76_3726 [Chitinophagaceae bacterium]|nr:hypothetical protein [Chitinophagaceae bacterium]
MESTGTLPLLNAEEIRVLGSLIEKSKTTPDYYPMTINSLTAACNQKTSRKPIVQYDESTVSTTLDSLRKKGLVSTATGGASRSIKYKHNFAIVFPLDPPQVTILCLLMLRGAQTPGELNTNSGRMYEFESLEEVQKVLEGLSDMSPSFVLQLPRKAGQKELRYTHLLGGVSEINDEEDESSFKPFNTEARLEKLEQEVKELRQAVDKLMKELGVS